MGSWVFWDWGEIFWLLLKGLLVSWVLIAGLFYRIGGKEKENDWLRLDEGGDIFWALEARF